LWINWYELQIYSHERWKGQFDICEIGNAALQWDMVFEGEQDVMLKWTESYGKSKVGCETDGQKEDWWFYEHARFETAENVAKANTMQCHEHVLIDEDNALRKAISSKMEGQKKQGWRWKTWKQV